MVNGLSRLADRPGEYILFIEAAPLPAVIHRDEMIQCLARAEKLPFGFLAVAIGRECLGHRVEFGQKS